MAVAQASRASPIDHAVDLLDAGRHSVLAAGAVRADRVAIAECLCIQRRAGAISPTTADDAVQRSRRQLACQLQPTVCLDSHADRFQRGIRTVLLRVGDDLTADVQASPTRVDHGLGDVLAVCLRVPGMRAPEPGCPADRLLLELTDCAATVTVGVVTVVARLACVDDSVTAPR